MRYELWIGLVGLLIGVAINAIALYAFNRESAQWFSERWYETWFPTYVVWLVFLIIGIAQQLFGRPTRSP